MQLSLANSTHLYVNKLLYWSGPSRPAATSLWTRLTTVPARFTNNRCAVWPLHRNSIFYKNSFNSRNRISTLAKWVIPRSLLHLSFITPPPFPSPSKIGVRIWPLNLLCRYRRVQTDTTHRTAMLSLVGGNRLSVLNTGCGDTNTVCLGGQGLAHTSLEKPSATEPNLA